MTEILWFAVGLLIGVVFCAICAPIKINITHEDKTPTVKELELSEEDKKYLEEQQSMYDAVREMQQLFMLGGENDDAK